MALKRIREESARSVIDLLRNFPPNWRSITITRQEKFGASYVVTAITESSGDTATELYFAELPTI